MLLQNVWYLHVEQFHWILYFIMFFIIIFLISLTASFSFCWFCCYALFNGISLCYSTMLIYCRRNKSRNRTKNATLLLHFGGWATGILEQYIVEFIICIAFPVDIAQILKQSIRFDWQWDLTSNMWTIRILVTVPFHTWKNSHAYALENFNLK